MERIKVVGVGPGSRDYLTPAAQKAAAWADVLVGGPRALGLFKHLGKREVTIDGRPERAVEFIRNNRELKVAVLVSGDPGLYSFLSYLRRHFDPGELDVIAGVSSVQVAFARACLPWQEAAVFSLHGRDGDRIMAEEVLPAVKGRQNVALLTDRNHPPQKVAAFLLQHGVLGLRVIVGECLTCPQEKVVEGSLEFIAACPEKFVNCVVLIVNDG